MTLEEGIKLANEGDLGAQISLGNHYMEQKDLDEAKKWYVMAAEKSGSPYATYLAALTSHTNALGNDIVMNHQSDEELRGMFDFFLAEWEDTYLWFNRSIACKEKNMPDTENIDLNELYQRKAEAAYKCSLYYYLMGNYEKAVNFSSGLSTTLARLVHNASLFQLAEKEHEYRESLTNMLSIVSDEAFLASSKMRKEDTICAICAVQLGICYEKGIGITSSPDIDKAINLLKLVNSYIKDKESNIKLTNEINKYVQLKSQQQTYSAPSSTSSSSSSSGGCYVATAVYGSYDCPSVWTLRRYRDDILASSWYGRAFIHTYYAISPTIVKWFGNTTWFKNMWRGKLDRLVDKLQKQGIENTPYDDKKW